MPKPADRRNYDALYFKSPPSGKVLSLFVVGLLLSGGLVRQVKSAKQVKELAGKVIKREKSYGYKRVSGQAKRRHSTNNKH